jgi:hypothetical protein
MAPWFPGAKVAVARSVTFAFDDYFEILRAIKFMA